jgi:hypothetical protein
MDKKFTDIEKISVRQLRFKKTKDKLTEHKKNYIISDFSGNRVSVVLEKVIIPFGYESFNNKFILNVEINPKSGNSHYNIHSHISTFENDFVNPENINSEEIIKDIEGKGYYNNMRKSKGGFILRAYVFGNPEIYMMSGKFKNLMTSADIKQTVSNVTLELGSFWVNDNNYGFIWYVKNIEVLHSV